MTASSNIAGAINIDIQPQQLSDGSFELTSRVQCQRPDIGKALEGLPLEQAWQRLPLLVALCPVAQQHAAFDCLNAISAETSQLIKPSQQALHAEWLAEHAWQTWQVLQQYAPVQAKQALTATIVLRKPNAENWQHAFESMLGLPLPSFLGLDTNQFDNWLHSNEAPYPSLLRLQRALLDFGKTDQPLIGDSTAYVRLTDKQFGLDSHHPIIDLIANHLGNGIGGRLLACWVEMALIIVNPKQAFYQPSATQASSINEAETSTAGTIAVRGWLYHRIQLHDGVIDSWQIDAPTDRYFAPDGFIARALNQQSLDDYQAIAPACDLFVRVCDPCVSYHINVMNSKDFNHA